MYFSYLKKLRFHPLFFILFFIAWYKKIFLEIFIIIFSLALHEIAHMITGIRLGYKIERYEFLIIGQRAIIKNLNHALPKEDILISLAGPVVSILLATISKFAIILGVQHRLVFFFFTINLIIGAFNLAPAFPLDGGRVLRAVLLHYTDITRANKISIIVSRSFSVILFILGVKQFLESSFNISLLCVSIFLWMASIYEEKKLQFSFLLQLMYKKHILRKQGVLEVKNIIALRNTPVSCVLKLFRMHRYHRIEIVNEEMEILGILEEQDLYEKIIEKGFYAHMEDLL